MDFPAVTVCNLNVMKASRLVDDPRYRNISDIDKRYKKEVQDLVGNNANGAPDGKGGHGDALNGAGRRGASRAAQNETSGSERVGDDRPTNRPPRKHFDASTFHAVEKQLGLIMKKVRRSRKTNGDGVPGTTCILPDGDERPTPQPTPSTTIKNETRESTEHDVEQKADEGNGGGEGEMQRERGMDEFDESYAYQLLTQENASLYGRTVFTVRGAEGGDSSENEMENARGMSKLGAKTEKPSVSEVGNQANDHLLRDKKHVKDENSVTASTPGASPNGDFEYQESGFSSLANDYEFNQLMEQSTSSDYSDLFQLLKPTSEDLERYGHQPNDFIVQCSFDTRNCSYRSHTVSLLSTCLRVCECVCVCMGCVRVRVCVRACVREGRFIAAIPMFSSLRVAGSD